jgi:hypothetical protein
MPYDRVSVRHWSLGMPYNRTSARCSGLNLGLERTVVSLRGLIMDASWGDLAHGV